MWGYQRHFQISVQMWAEELFKALHPQYEVQTFLLGLARKTDPNLHPVCLEPEECGFRPEEFESVRETAKHFQAIDPDRGMICTHPIHQKAVDRRLEAKCLQKAVLSEVDRWHDNASVRYFFSGVVPVADYDVGVVLRLQCKAEEQPYRLPKVHSEERYAVPHSLVEAAASEFLADCLRSLYTGAPELVDDYDGRNKDELLRQAGQRLMDAPVWVGSDGIGIHGLFGACNFISSLTYESEGSVGSMLVAAATHKNIERTITLASPVYLRKHRAVRKLLQIASAGHSLLCDGSNIIGFGHVTGNYDQAEADLFEIRFTQHYRWELVHGGHRMMTVNYGVPALPLPPLNGERLASDLSRIFKDQVKDSVPRLVQLAMEACKQRHGALLVITPDAEKEAERLATQCTRIVPVLLTPSLVRSVSSIDGAILVSPRGICYAIGAILDGKATPFGDSGRGARFNSSIRYVAERRDCVAIIISEDGTAEWLPNLRPQLSRKELNDMQSQALELLKGPGDDKKEHKAIRWLDEHRFYLPADLCDTANKLVALHNGKAQQKGYVTIVYAPFEPNPDMCDEYLQG
jgi:hypothetical protein